MAALQFPKNSRIATLLAVLTWIPLWGQSPSVRVDSSHNQKQQTKLGATKAQADQRGTKNSPVFVDMVQHPKSEQEAAKEKREKERKALIDGWTLGIAAAVALFTGTLVIIGWRGVNAAKRTLKAIERQATLQAASMTQWVSVDKWDATYPEPTELGGPIRLDMGFWLVNESNFPLTAQGYIDFFGRLPEATRCNIIDAFVVPNKPLYIPFHLYISEEQHIQFCDRSTGLTIAVHGEITHVGVVKERGPLMRLSGNLVCGLGRQTSLEMATTRLVPENQTGDRT